MDKSKVSRCLLAHPVLQYLRELLKFVATGHTVSANREGEVGGKLPRARRRLGAPLSLKNMKYTRMHHLKN